MLAISNNMTGAACPIVPHTLPSLAPGAAGSMLQLLLDDSFLNCVSYVRQCASGHSHPATPNQRSVRLCGVTAGCAVDAGGWLPCKQVVRYLERCLDDDSH